MTEHVYDSQYFIEDPNRWSRRLAQELAGVENVGSLSEDHWRVIDYLRTHYLAHHTLPVMRHVCSELDLHEGCIGRLFHTPTVAWRVAGLPDPGEEAKAYLETSEIP